MAGITADPKAALLSDELKEFALTLPPTGFPKAGNGNFFCALCSNLAFDSWKLLCCNKSICSTCHAKLEFPTTCPLCDHTPLEADTCTPNKSLRNTMRAWLQKAKKKEEAKKVETPTMEATASTIPPTNDPTPDNLVQSVESVQQGEGDLEHETTPSKEQNTDTIMRGTSVGSKSDEQTTPIPATDAQEQPAIDPQDTNTSGEPTTATDETGGNPNPGEAQGNSAMGNGAMFNQMNGAPGQFGYGFNPNQGNFNGMGWNGMNQMNGMPNMMGGANWNMNPMDFNNMNAMNAPNMPNGMYGGFGGNMGMPGMNDMSAMNMMNFGGGFGNDWQGGMNGAGYGGFNGYNQMGGYNQSGAQYPQMMNQFPKNNIPNQNRFHANGAAFSQKSSRRGSQGNFGNQNGPGSQHSAHSRPGSRAGPQNPDEESPADHADAVPETGVDGEQAEESVEAGQGKADGDNSSTAQANHNSRESNELTGAAEDGSDSLAQSSALNQIQTVDSGEHDVSAFHQSDMNEAMMAGHTYPQEMMNGFQNQGYDMNGPYGGNMGYNQNKYGNNNYGGHHGGFNAAYGAATVLTGEPRGGGVEGAPTGPRAMREGRPNTGFSSRTNTARFNGPPNVSSASSAKEVPTSPPRRGRGSPQRDDTLRVKDKSPSRSRSRSRSVKDNDVSERSRARSEDHEMHQNQQEESVNVTDDEDRHKDRRSHRSSRHDAREDIDGRESHRDEVFDDRHRREERGDRTRSTSADSRHRSRREKEDKHRSSRSHRDRSREHRRRHRSRSPVEDEKHWDDADIDNNDVHSDHGGRRKSRIEKDKYRERSRERDRSRDRDRDRDRDRRDRDRRDREHDRDYDKEKERSRDKDRDRKRSRRDRDHEDQRERDYVEDKHRSSRRNRKDRDRERERDRDADRDSDTKESSANRAISPPLNAPTGPSADGFSIRGFSKVKKENGSTSRPMPPPPTGPRSLQAPKGPAADRDRRESRDHKRTNSHSGSVPPSPTTASDNHYADDRDRHDRDRVLQTLHGRATGRSNTTPSGPAASSSSSRHTLTSKRSREDFDRDEGPPEDFKHRPSTDRENRIPTGPASHRDKRRKSGATGDDAIANLFSGALRKQRTRERRGGVKMEGDAERDLERTERDRDRRW